MHTQLLQTIIHWITIGANEWRYCMSEEFIKEMTAEHIKSMRMKTGLTQEEFCEHFGLNLNTFRHWERGDRKPTGSSLVLLNMIESSGHEVLKILNGVNKTEGHMSDGKNLLIDIFERRKFLTLEDYISSNEFNIDTIPPLLRANGFPYVKAYEESNSVIFKAGYELNTLKEVLKIDMRKKSYCGDFKKIINKTYLVAYALEQDLRDAVFWSPAMRKERVENILKEIDVDSEFYNNVLRNW